MADGLKIFSWNQILSGDFPLEWKKKGVALAVGSFDGMHLGHKALVDSVLSNKNLVHGIVTFNSSCHSVGGPCPGDVVSIKQKMSVASSLSLDFAIAIDFSPDFAKIQGPDFIDSLIEFCGMKFMAEGRDFRCGYKGALDMNGLESISRDKGFFLSKVDDVVLDGCRISSSRIRESINKKDFDFPRKAMGRPFAYDCTSLVFIDKSFGNKPSSCEIIAKCTGNQIVPPDGNFGVRILTSSSLILSGDCRIFTDGNQKFFELSLDNAGFGFEEFDWLSVTEICF